MPILISVLVFVVSLVLAWAAGPVLHITGSSLLILRILLVLLGLAASLTILFFYLRNRRREAGIRNVQGNSELEVLLRDSERKLSTAQRSGGKSLDSLPLLYILGEANAAKTTTILKSGLDPELLAGQIYRDQDVVPTPVVNLWYSQQCVLVEAGDAVRKSPQLWRKLVRKTRPRAYRAALGSQAPVRAAVVCVSCEQFAGTAASETVPASARAANQMLRDLAQQLGTEVPVYVILTKLDRVPNFAEFVRNLSTEEAAQPFGIAMPRSETASGLYAEKATQDTTSHLDQLIFSLGEFRLEVLSRESDLKNVDPAYEFPREMRKLRNNLSAYLVELTRPSHLNANPYLRGFWFTGVRAHIVEQMVSASAPSVQAPQADAGATRMFSFQQMQAAAAPTPQVVAQKIAQWCFLPKLFPVAILQDRSALAGTSYSGRTHLLRRIVFGTVSALLFLYLICLVISWSNNASLAHRINSAAEGLPVKAVPATALASTQDLTSLESLREVVAQLDTYQHDGPPLMYRWGLYHGDAMLAAARALYFDRFRRLLLTNTQTNLVAMLSALPAAPAPGADYGAAYNPLRAYLITTSNADKSTPEFMTPVLVQAWQNGIVPESAQQKQLAQQQFDFYASYLQQHGNPYSIVPVTPAVTHARTYLSSFGGFERIYQQMIAAANKAAPSVDFNRVYPGSSQTVIESHIVSGAFTRQGFAFMQSAIQHPANYFSGEAWVLGDQAPPSLDQAGLTQQLATRYVSDYLSEWRTYLRDASVVRYRSLQDAATKLNQISNNNSPLLALVYLASHNTAVANDQIKSEFQPAQTLVAPDSADKLISPGNTSYVNSLISLQGSVSQIAQNPAAATDPAQTGPVTSAAIAAHGAARQTAQAFTIDQQGHVDQTLLGLMEDPITSVEALARGAGAAQANGGGKSFCAAFTQTMNKFPFSPASDIDATPSEVASLLQPGTGALWQFYNANLKILLIQQGPAYAAAPNAPMKVSPAFVRFFNQAATLSAQLFPAGAAAPSLTFTAHVLPSKGMQSATLAVDAQRLSGADSTKQFTWSAQSAQSAQLLGSIGATDVSFQQFNGPWALFHLVQKGREDQPGDPYRRLYPLQSLNTQTTAAGSALAIRVDFSGPGAAMLMPGAMGGLRCVSEVAH
nr:ImcF-related family protein [Paracidobacterium acidisoli]